MTETLIVVAPGVRIHGATNARQLRAVLPELTGSYDPAPGKRWGGATPLAPRAHHGRETSSPGQRERVTTVKRVFWLALGVTVGALVVRKLSSAAGSNLMTFCFA